jgi:hypothetical protein
MTRIRLLNNVRRHTIPRLKVSKILLKSLDLEDNVRHLKQVTDDQRRAIELLEA